MAYWQADRWPRACRCPVCRREVTLLLSNPWYERSGRYPDLTHQIQDYNLRMSGQMRPVSILEDLDIKIKCSSICIYLTSFYPLLYHLFIHLYSSTVT